MKRLFILTILATSMMLLNGCAKSDFNNESDKVEISFNSFLKEGDNIRPFSEVSKALGGDLATGYILNGTQTPGLYLETAISSRDRFHYNIPMNLDGSPKDGTFGKVYWNNNGATYHSFTAYSVNPTGTAAGDGIVTIGRVDVGASTGQDVYAVFKQPADPAKQIDFLTAESMNLQVKEAAPSAVNLYFSHRLSRVNFRVFGSGAVPLEQCSATLTYGGSTLAPMGQIGTSNLSVQGLNIMRSSSGDYEFAPERLQSSSRYTGSYAIGGLFEVSSGNADIPTAVVLGDMILLPQDLKEGWAELKISYTANGLNKTLSCPLPALLLRATMEASISFNIMESSNRLTVSEVAVRPWGSASGIIDRLPGMYSLSLSSNGAQVPLEGGSYDVTVTSNARWFVKSKPDGVIVDKLEGLGGSTGVTITVPANIYGAIPVIFSTIGDDATASIATWNGMAAPVITLDKTSQADILVAGGDYTVKVTSNYAWSVSSAVSGVSFNPASGAAGADVSVVITVPQYAASDLTRDIPVVFKATSAEGDATATWTGTQSNGSFIPRAKLVESGWSSFSGAVGLQVAMRGDKQDPVSGTAGSDPTFQWKTSNTATSGVENVTSFADAVFGIGKANTDAMIAAGAGTHPAAEYCRSMGAEWYLPSVKELKAICDNKSVLGPNYTFADYYYWSSTENYSTNSWYVFFNGGGTGSNGKSYSGTVRCVREI